MIQSSCLHDRWFQMKSLLLSCLGPSQLVVEVLLVSGLALQKGYSLIELRLKETQEVFFHGSDLAV